MVLWSIDFWKPTVIFNFKDFILEFNPIQKTVYSRFPDGHWSGGKVGDNDLFHATLLGLEPELYLLQRILAHHLIGIKYYNAPYSPTMWDIAHQKDLTPESTQEEEWLTTALQYFSRGRSGPAEADNADAISAIRQKNIDATLLGQQLQVMVDVAKFLNP